MEMTITTDPDGRTVVCSVTGTPTLAGAIMLLERGGAAAPPGQPVLLIDLLQLEGGLSIGAQFELGTATREALARYRKVAVVQNSAAVENSGFGALVAQNRGLNIQVFDTLVEARAWLDAPPAKSPKAT